MTFSRLPPRRAAAASLLRDVFPLFECDTRGDPPDLLEFRGTGFRLTPDLLVTCWHCLDLGDREDQRGMALTYRRDGGWTMCPLLDAAQDANGSDLGTARIHDGASIPSGPGLQLGTTSLLNGTDIATFGYPDTTRVRVESTSMWAVDARWLQGYVTRLTMYPEPTYGDTPSYELDMPAPRGISGAPLFRKNGGWEVFGVVYGAHDVASVEHVGYVDPDTGERTPETQRIVSFALATLTDTLHDLRGPATDGLPLAEHLAARRTSEG